MDINIGHMFTEIVVINQGVDKRKSPALAAQGSGNQRNNIVFVEQGRFLERNYLSFILFVSELPDYINKVCPQFAGAAEIADPVSYTHLDVYKRQPCVRRWHRSRPRP